MQELDKKYWQHCYLSVYKQVIVLVVLVFVVAHVRSNFFFAQLRKSAANGEVNWYCPKEQSLMTNDIRELMEPKFSRRLSYS